MGKWNFWCEVVEGELTLVEAECAKWLTEDTLYDVQWLPADARIIEKIRKCLSAEACCMKLR